MSKSFSIMIAFPGTIQGPSSPTLRGQFPRRSGARWPSGMVWAGGIYRVGFFHCLFAQHICLMQNSQVSLYQNTFKERTDLFQKSKRNQTV